MVRRALGRCCRGLLCPYPFRPRQFLRPHSPRRTSVSAPSSLRPFLPPASPPTLSSPPVSSPPVAPNCTSASRRRSLPCWGRPGRVVLVGLGELSAARAQLGIDVDSRCHGSENARGVRGAERAWGPGSLRTAREEFVAFCSACGRSVCPKLRALRGPCKRYPTPGRMSCVMIQGERIHFFDRGARLRPHCMTNCA